MKKKLIFYSNRSDYYESDKNQLKKIKEQTNRKTILELRLLQYHQYDHGCSRKLRHMF